MRNAEAQMTLVDDNDSLCALAEHLSTAARIAVDTEFVRERTYFPKPCLLQVATKDTLACVDCLADIDLSPLYESLFRADCEWVLHSARQDLEIFWIVAGRLPARLFDTQLAAGLVGHAPQIGLQDLVQTKLGISLDKTMTRTDWSRRPLPEGAVEYALDDVRYLLELAQALAEDLARLDRLHWFDEDARRLVADPPVTDMVTLWQRLRGVGGLPERSQAAALALIRWREREAQRLDRPRRWILADEVLLRVARQLPQDQSSLASIPELPKRLAREAGAEILAAVAEAGSSALQDEVLAATPARADKTELKAMQSHVKSRAEALRIHSEVLATRRDLAALVAGVPPAILTEGWRAEQLAAT